jgi:hypothetical protein
MRYAIDAAKSLHFIEERRILATLEPFVKWRKKFAEGEGPQGRTSGRARVQIRQQLQAGVYILPPLAFDIG